MFLVRKTEGRTDIRPFSTIGPLNRQSLETAPDEDEEPLRLSELILRFFSVDLSILPPISSKYYRKQGAITSRPRHMFT